MMNKPITTEEEIYTHNCSICGDEFTDSNKYSSYCKPCKSYYNKQYRIDNEQHIKQYMYKLRHTGYYIYIFCKGNEVQYVGATEGIYYRIHYQHLKGLSHIKDFINSDEWDNVKYMDLTDIIDDRKELLFCEDYFIDKFKPQKNKSLSNIHLADDIVKNLLEKIDKLLFNVYYIR